MRATRRALAALPLFAWPLPALTQEAWPSRPLRFVVPYPPGGASDFLARLAAEHMTRTLGQPVVVDNRSGAGGNLGTELVARSVPDGYTLALGAIGTLAVNRFLFRALPYDPDRDFAPVSLIGIVPNLMVVPPQLPVTNVEEFLAYVRARPGQINYGSIGNGTSQHLAGVQFDMIAGTRMVHVPYRDPAQVNTDLMEGRVQVLFQSISAVAELARSGRMRALAVTGGERVPAFPDTPTLRERGLDITTTGWFGMVAPAGTPEAVLERLNAAVNAAMADSRVARRVIESGSIPRAGSRAGFAAFIAEETTRLREIVRVSGAVAD